MLVCDYCSKGWHMGCLTPPLVEIPTSDWVSSQCTKYTCFVVLCQGLIQRHRNLLIGIVDDSRMVVIWLNIGDYNQATNDGAHIVLNLLISSCLELNSFHGLPYHNMSYFTIDLDIQCKWTFISTRGGNLCACFHDHVHDFVSFNGVGHQSCSI